MLSFKPNPLLLQMEFCKAVRKLSIQYRLDKYHIMAFAKLKQVSADQLSP